MMKQVQLSQSQIIQDIQNNLFTKEIIDKEKLEYKKTESAIIQQNYIIADSQKLNLKVYEWDDSVAISNFTVFGHKYFRQNQKQIINAIKCGKDVLVCMPAGGGKSLLFQLPAYIEDGISVVIMHQECKIQKQQKYLKNIMNIYSIKNYYSKCEFQKIIKQILQKDSKASKLLFISAQKIKDNFVQKQLQQLYQNNLINRFVIDDAHCITQYAYDYREEYLNLKQLRIDYSSIPILAIVQTAKKKVLIRTINLLNMSNVLYFQSSFYRSNLIYKVLQKQKKKDNMKNLVFLLQNKFKNQSGIIYCCSITQCELMTQNLQKFEINCKSYTNAKTNREKYQIQNDFINNKIQVIVTTIAYKININKADLRFIINDALPLSMENYYEQIAQVGRDNKPSFCYLNYNKSDVNSLYYLLQSSSKFLQKIALYNINSMILYALDDTQCRNKIILNHFKEDFDIQKCNSTCDNCKKMQKYQYYKEIDCFELIKGLQEIFKMQQFQQKQNITVNLLLEFAKAQNNKKFQVKAPSIFQQFYRYFLERFLHECIKCKILEQELQKIQHEFYRQIYITVNINEANLQQYLCRKKIMQIKMLDKSKNKLNINIEKDRVHKSQNQVDFKTEYSQINQRKSKQQYDETGFAIQNNSQVKQNQNPQYNIEYNQRELDFINDKFVFIEDLNNEEYQKNKKIQQ